MKTVQHLLLVATLVFASCQCVTAAEPTYGADMAMEDCHDAPAVEVVSDDCCEQDATTAKVELPKKHGGLDATAITPPSAAKPLANRAAFDFERRRGPPRFTTPTARFDCLRI